MSETATQPTIPEAAAGGLGDYDAKLEKLLYERFLDKTERQHFVEFFKEIETLCEILSPDPQLRDYIDD